MADLEIRETAQVIWELKDQEDSTDMWIQGTLDEFFLLPGLPDSPVNEEIPTFPQKTSYSDQSSVAGEAENQLQRSKTIFCLL